MILIKNTQRKIQISTKKLHKNAQKMLLFLDYQDFDLGIWFTTNKTIQKYNKLYRGKNKPTDILSFPYHDKLKAGKRISVLSEEDKNLGDIIISVEFVEKEAKTLSFTLE